MRLKLRLQGLVNEVARKSFDGASIADMAAAEQHLQAYLLVMNRHHTSTSHVLPSPDPELARKRVADKQPVTLFKKARHEKKSRREHVLSQLAVDGPGPSVSTLIGAAIGDDCSLCAKCHQDEDRTTPGGVPSKGKGKGGKTPATGKDKSNVLWTTCNSCSSWYHISCYTDGCVICPSISVPQRQ
jgi:hypothetical protein